VPRILEPHAAWTAEDVADETTWTEQLSDDERTSLDEALRHALATKGDDVLEIGKDDFPITADLAAHLKAIEQELIDGRGFVRIRGIDRGAYTQAEMEVLYWGIGMHLGLPWEQNKHGHVLGDVTDQEKAPDDPTARGNELGGVALPFHCDGSDLVGLMCLANGREGGLSMVASSVHIHNALVETRPDLAEALYQPFPYDARGEQADGAKGFYELPVFTEHDGRLFCRAIPPYIVASQRHPDAPRLTADQQEALKALVDMADDPANHVAMELQPGDIQLINNFHVLHGRTAYADDRQHGKVRHLKRLWLETETLASRPPIFEHRRTHWADKRSASRLQPTAPTQAS
jgi:hypothetical protein